MKKKIWVINAYSGSTAELLLYGFIGQYECIDDAAFITDLRALEGKYTDLNIRINCGGGDVYKGLTIFNAIRNSTLKTHGKIDGIAGSMGAVVAAACDDVEMSKYARYMTHRVTGFNGGNADDMRTFADELEQLETTIATILAKRTGLPVDEAKTKYITDQDRWIGADQALTEKLIDAIYDADPVDLPTTENADTSKMFNAFEKVYNISTTKNDNMKFITALLGLSENATEAEITTAINKLKDDKATAENAVKKTVESSAKNLVSAAIGEGRLVEADRVEYEEAAVENFDRTAKMINKLPVTKKPMQTIVNKDKPEGGEGAEDNWEALQKKGTAAVASCKAETPEVYKQLFKTHYGREPKMD